MGRTAIFIVQVVWLVVLGTVAYVYFADRNLIPLGDSLGSVPLAVVWFGALGAVLISLTGIVEHAHDWDESFALWHLSRPLVGASLAIVGVLILQAGILAVGSSPNVTVGSSANATAGASSTMTGDIPKNLLYYLVAFLVGYREETFRELIKRLVDLILAPGTTTSPTIRGLNPATAAAAGGGQVVISGAGFIGATAVTFGSQSAAFKVDSDSQITAQLPQAATPGQVTVTVQGKSGSASASFQYT